MNEELSIRMYQIFYFSQTPPKLCLLYLDGTIWSTFPTINATVNVLSSLFRNLKNSVMNIVHTHCRHAPNVRAFQFNEQ